MLGLIWHTEASNRGTKQPSGVSLFLTFPDGISAGLIQVEKLDDPNGDHRSSLPVDNPSRSAEWHHVDGLTGRRDDRRNGTLQLVLPERLRQPRNGKSAPLR